MVLKTMYLSPTQNFWRYPRAYSVILKDMILLYLAIYSKKFSGQSAIDEDLDGENF